MILNVESDAAHLVMPGACIHITGPFYLSNHTTNLINPSNVKTNGPILTKCNTLQHVVVSGAESETGGFFINVQNIVQMRTYLI